MLMLVDLRHQIGASQEGVVFPPSDSHMLPALEAAPSFFSSLFSSFFSFSSFSSDPFGSLSPLCWVKPSPGTQGSICFLGRSIHSLHAQKGRVVTPGCPHPLAPSLARTQPFQTQEEPCLPLTRWPQEIPPGGLLALALRSVCGALGNAESAPASPFPAESLQEEERLWRSLLETWLLVLQRSPL